MSLKKICYICGEDLVLLENNKNITCLYCQGTFLSDCKCICGHFICEYCHALSGNDIIEKYSNICTSQNPFEIALTLMKHPFIKMHGPEHHFLIPAVLLSSYYNRQNNSSNKKQKKETDPSSEKNTKRIKIKQARKRAENISQGNCGFMGNCGAAIGTGIFTNLIMETNKPSKKEWQKENIITAKTLLNITSYGGPRCCKRNTLLAINTVINEFKWKVTKKIKCAPNHKHKKCSQKKCLYY